MILKKDDANVVRRPNFKGGELYLDADIFSDESGKIIRGFLPPKGSIGLHTHDDSYEVIYIIKGNAKFVYEDKVEYASSGDIHYCPYGKSHTFINDSEDIIEFIGIVPNK